MKKLIALFLLLSITFIGYSQSNTFKSVRFSPQIDTTGFTTLNGTVVRHTDGDLYVKITGGWEKLNGTGGGGSVLANNGLSLSGDTVQLGGTLTKNTDINYTGIGTKYFTYNFYNTDPIYDYGGYLSVYTGGIDLTTYSGTSKYQTDIFNRIGSDPVYPGIYNDIRGGNYVVRTNNSNTFTYNERLKIDSVGNVSFPNTKLFDLNSGNFNIDGNGVSFIIDGKTDNDQSYSSLYAGYDDGLTLSKYAGIGVDGTGNIVNESKGGVFSVRTELATSTGVIERLKIDSVGNVRINNTENFSVYSPTDGQILFETDDLSANHWTMLQLRNVTDGGFGTLFESKGAGFIVSTSLSANPPTVKFSIDSTGAVIIGDPAGITSTVPTIDMTAGTSLATSSYISMLNDFIGIGSYGTGGGSFEVDSDLNKNGIYATSLEVLISADAGTTGEYLGSDGAGKVVWGTPSDRRLKENISPVTKGLSVIDKLEPVSFKYKKSDEQTVGFIAQDVEKVLPEMVTKKKNGMKHLKNYTYLEPYLVKAIQELTDKVERLEKQVEELEGRTRRPRYKR